MRYYLALGIFLLGGCSQKELPTPQSFVDVAPPASMVWSTSISQDRRSAIVMARNSSNKAVFCPLLSFRVIYDDPLNYLETGEFSVTHLNHFVSPNESNTFSELKSPQRGAHIRSVQAGRLDSCRVATFADICRKSQDDDTLHKLLESSGTRSCEGFFKRLLESRLIDLRELGLEVVPHLRELNFEVSAVLSESQRRTDLGSAIETISTITTITFLKDKCEDETIADGVVPSSCLAQTPIAEAEE